MSRVRARGPNGGSVLAMTCRLSCAIVALVSCTTVQNAAVTDPSTTLDETVFRCNVEPILARQCSYLGCHGNAGTALRVYTPGKLRAAPPANIDESEAALSDDEQHGNFTSAAGFSLPDASPGANLLLLKPLPESFGGREHLGGAIFTSTDDPQFVAIYRWLTGGGACAD